MDPCGMVVWKIVPAIRRTLAEELLKRGRSRKEVAEILGVSPAALTQYVKGKRGRYELPDWAVEIVREYAEKDCVNVCDVCLAVRSDPRFGLGGRRCGDQG